MVLRHIRLIVLHRRGLLTGGHDSSKSKNAKDAGDRSFVPFRTCDRAPESS
jgi:hypothetical protein